MEMPRSSQLRCGDCAGLVHELSNTVTAVLMNAQLLGWRLPPYSRLKRPVLELERNAQRSSELLKRLARQFGDGAAEPDSGMEWSGRTLPAQEPPWSAASTANLPPCPLATAVVAPDFSADPPELTQDCDPCTSRTFPKGDDGNER